MEENHGAAEHGRSRQPASVRSTTVIRFQQAGIPTWGHPCRLSPPGLRPTRRPSHPAGIGHRVSFYTTVVTHLCLEGDKRASSPCSPVQASPDRYRPPSDRQSSCRASDCSNTERRCCLTTSEDNDSSYLQYSVRTVREWPAVIRILPETRAASGPSSGAS